MHALPPNSSSFSDCTAYQKRTPTGAFLMNRKFEPHFGIKCLPAFIKTHFFIDGPDCRHPKKALQN